MSQIIVFATPVFLLLIALEFAVGRWRARRGTGLNTYGLSDTINSITLGTFNQLTNVLGKVFTIGVYAAVYGMVHTAEPAMTGSGSGTTAFWNSALGLVLALLFYDFCYYWLHRAGHRVAVFWAAHVVHHQSQHYNLSTALRQTSSGLLLGWVFYLPMALAGVPPAVFALVAIIDLLYQFWVHTEQIGKLGWFDRVFCSPSNHRVHHAVNDGYLDKNYGGILVLWDRWFGTFQEEQEPCVYGTRAPLQSWDPLWANLEVYWALAQASWRTRRWADKVRVWFKPPGWQPADLAAAHPYPAFVLGAVPLYRPPLSPGQQWFAAAQFALALLGVSQFLWVADSLPWANAALMCATLAAGLWALGLYLQGRLTALEVLALECASVATLSALGLPALHLIAKPMVMAIAIVFVAARAISTGVSGRFDAYLGAALLFSMAGDVFLMQQGDYFIPGLGSFLVAHLFYIALFRQGVGWFPSRRALTVTLAFGAAMLAVLWGALGDPVLRGAVAAYVLVISLMTGQALGRAAVLGTASARWVGAAACVFMLSDTLIAINRFLTPVPLAPLWILLTYYTAQLLIVHHARPSDSPAG